MDHEYADTRSISSCDLIDLSFDLHGLLNYLLLGVVGHDYDFEIFSKGLKQGDEVFLCFLGNDLGRKSLSTIFPIYSASPNREFFQFRVVEYVDTQFSGTAPDQLEWSESL